MSRLEVQRANPTGRSGDSAARLPSRYVPNNVIQSPEHVSDVAKAIQLALAPVFLLTGIAGMLNVMTGRLARIVDRGRDLMERGKVAADRQEELLILERRRRLVSVAITACAIASLSLCVVIATLFVGALLDVRLDWVVGALFTMATLALIVGLAFFLREVLIASRALRLLEKKM